MIRLNRTSPYLNASAVFCDMNVEADGARPPSSPPGHDTDHVKHSQQNSETSRKDVNHDDPAASPTPILNSASRNPTDSTGRNGGTFLRVPPPAETHHHCKSGVERQSPDVVGAVTSAGHVKHFK